MCDGSQKINPPLSITSVKFTADLPYNQFAHSCVFRTVVTGNGSVVASADNSMSIWTGFASNTQKSGDGSGHCFTSFGELGAYGVGGYNELGLFVGEATNTGSLKGTIAGVEVLVKDSPDAGATSYDTKMFGVTGRVAKYHPSIRSSSAFLASSEGSRPVNNVLSVNPQGATFNKGIDLGNALLVEGIALEIPSGSSISARMTDGLTKPMLSTDAEGTKLSPTSDTAAVCLRDYSGNNRVVVHGDSRLGLYNQDIRSPAASNRLFDIVLIINGTTVRIPAYEHT